MIVCLQEARTECWHHLSFGNKLLFVVFGRVSWNLTCPQGDAHGRVRTSHNAKGQEVDQQCHAHVVSTAETGNVLMMWKV